MPKGICVIDGCDEFRVAGGWCRRHYYSWSKYGDPLATERAKTAPKPVLTCMTCGEQFERPSQMGPVPTKCRPCKLQVKREASKRYHQDPRNRSAILRHQRRQEPVTDPACEGCGEQFDRAFIKGPVPRLCVTCRDARQVERRHAANLRHRCAVKGITVEQYYAVLAAQGNRCASCRGEFGAKGPLIDHDHACCPGTKGCVRCFRGLLCGPCNFGIGSLRDDPAVIAAALEFVLKARRRRDERTAAGGVSGLVLP